MKTKDDVFGLIRKMYGDDYGILEYVKPDVMWDLLIVNKRDYLISIF
jgi:hypothetical protein